MQERLRLVIQEIEERFRSEIRERTYEEIMVAHRDKLAILNITLCRECFHPIKLEGGEYCDSLLAERSELEEDDDEIALDVGQDVRRITDGHIIPSHRVTVWIENTLELSNPKILNGLENIREFPEEKGEEANDNVNGNNQNDNEVAGKGILNYNVDDLAKEFED
ncbi:hypothetical protein C1646_764254 [Rhizophagus diaphanus]|nr:hypothetical protein C1646_764254 [Rhizophagus diaphanus] [Rhizophagus sp. MUCL 43196]